MYDKALNDFVYVLKTIMAMPFPFFPDFSFGQVALGSFIVVCVFSFVYHLFLDK